MDKSIKITKRGWGGVRKGSGRPFTDPEKVRSEKVAFMLTKAELAKLKAAAGDVSLSRWIRNTILKALKRRK